MIGLDRPKRVFSLILLLMVVWLNWVSGSETHEERIAREIKHAETCYWFGMAERGNMTSFKAGLAFLESAKAGLLEHEARLDEDQKELLQRRIEALRYDLEEQAEIAHDTLYGLFPLVKFMKKSLFADPFTLGTHEMVDDPVVVASTAAVSSIVSDVLLKWTARTQLDVVFNSVPKNVALENEALYIFNSSPKFFVHNYREVVEALAADDLKTFQEGRITAELARLLCDTWNAEHLLVVTVREQDVMDGDQFYLAEGKIFARTTGFIESFVNMGFCRDRRGQFWPVMFIQLLFFLGAILAYRLSRRPGGIEKAGWGEVLLVPSVSFVIGRILPWALAPLVSSVSPAPEALAITSFWYPSALGVAVCVLPALFYKVAVTRLAPSGSRFRFEGRGGAVSLAVGFGISAYLAVPLLLYREEQGLLALGFCLLCVLPTAILTGRALDKLDPAPFWWFGAALASGLIFGSLYGHAGTAPLGLMAVITMSGAGSIILLSERQRDVLSSREASKDQKGPTPHLDEAVLPGNVAELAALTANPPYSPGRTFAQARGAITPLLQGGVSWLGLHGTSGSGKTATCRALIEYLKSSAEQNTSNPRGNKGRWVILEGKCQEPIGDSAPYAPFRQALASYFEVNLLASPQGQLQKIDSAIGGLLDSMIPFSGLLFPPADSGSGASVPKEETYVAIANLLLRLADQPGARGIVLFLDDVQWIDSASRDLLTFLAASFPTEKETPIAFLLAGKTEDVLNRLGLNKQQILAVVPPDENERANILIEKFRFQPDTARQLISHIGVAGGEQGEMFWMFALVRRLAEQGMLELKDGGFAWSDEFPGFDSLPLPDDMKRLLEEQLESHPQYREVLECAACLGREFRESVLAESLEMSSLRLIKLLDEIEAKTGIVRDSRESDDLYEFSSSFLLQTIRDKIQIKGRGPKAKDVPQIVREYHARVARSLEKQLLVSNSAIYEVAGQYYAAGRSQAAKALEYCLRAARTAAASYLHDKARDYVAMGRECAEVLGVTAEMEVDFLSIECPGAHIEGRQRAHAADRMAEYLEKNPNALIPVLILAARTFYDARRFAATFELGSRIVESAASKLQSAEGYQFMGLSTPLEDRAGREAMLRKSLAELGLPSTDDIPAQGAYARIIDSLAQELSASQDPERKLEAEALLRESIRIKLQLDDKPGLARSYGGLGRLYLFQTPPRLDMARELFAKDLVICEEIRDLVGLAKMHSFLGECDRREGKYHQNASAEQLGAIGHYRESMRIARDVKTDIDAFFAALGLLECYVSLGVDENIREMGHALLGMALEKDERTGEEKGVPRPCIETLIRVLAQVPETEITRQWLEPLKKLAVSRPS